MSPSRGLGAGALLVIVIAVAVPAALLRGCHPPREAADLAPRPDALEYGLAAASLATHGTYRLDVAGVPYPPRYPYGFPVLATPFVFAAGGDPSATWHAALVFGVLAVIVAALLGFLAGGAPGALAASALCAFSPGAWAASRVAMSETASMFTVGSALLCALLAVHRLGMGPADAFEVGRKRRVRAWLLLAGLALAAATSIRYTNLAALVPVALLTCTGARRGETLRALPWLLAPVLLALGALVAYQRATFGGFLENGYRFWVPEIYAHADRVFSVAYAAKGIPGYWPEGHLAVYGRELAGKTNTLWTPAFVALAALGSVRALFSWKRCPAARATVLVMVSFVPAAVLFHVVYVWQDERFLLPLLPALALAAAQGAALVRAAVVRVTPRLADAVAIGTVLACLAWMPWRAMIPSAPSAPNPPFTQRLAQLDARLPRDAVVIVNFPVTLAIPALGGGGREVLVTQRENADPHLNRIALHGLHGLDGRVPIVEALAAGGVTDPETVARLVAAARAGRPVVLVTAAGEADPGPGADALRAAGCVRDDSIRPFLLERIVPDS